MTFQDFIDRTGVANLATMLDCTEASIYKWRSAQSAPRPETAYILTQLSHGQLSLEAIFMPYVERQLNGKKINLKSADGKFSGELTFNF